MKVTIVSPTYNEAENVPRLVHDVGTVLSGIDYELLIADDDSPDRTWAVAQELATQNPRIRVLRRTTDRGLSPAVIEGFLSSSSDYVGVIDADLQHDPAILPQMIAALDAGAEIAVGSRYVEGGGTGTWNAARRFQSWVATKLAQTFLGVELTDPMSGYFILRRGDFNRIHKQLDASGFKILLEIIARLAPSRLEEVPYTFRDTCGWPIEVVVKSRSPVPGTTLETFLCQPLHVRSLRQVRIRRRIGNGGQPLRFLEFCRLLGLRDWRISALATLFANLTNYVFNNAWTFVDRGHRGWSSVARVCYLSGIFLGRNVCFDANLRGPYPGLTTFICTLFNRPKNHTSLPLGISSLPSSSVRFSTTN